MVSFLGLTCFLISLYSFESWPTGTYFLFVNGHNFIMAWIRSQLCRKNLFQLNLCIIASHQNPRTPFTLLETHMRCLLAVWTNWLSIWLNFCKNWCKAPLTFCTQPFLSFHVSFKKWRSDPLRFLTTNFWLLDFGIWFIFVSDSFKDSSPFIYILIIEHTSFHFVVANFHSFLR